MGLIFPNVMEIPVCEVHEFFMHLSHFCLAEIHGDFHIIDQIDTYPARRGWYSLSGPCFFNRSEKAAAIKAELKYPFRVFRASVPSKFTLEVISK